MKNCLKFWLCRNLNASFAGVATMPASRTRHALEKSKWNGRIDMDFNEYQELTQSTAIYPGQGGIGGLNYSIIGMVGEAGEVANRFKKVLRDDASILTRESRAEILAECGDTLWYLTRICEELGESLEYVAASNIAKLQERATRNKIVGTGNNR